MLIIFCENFFKICPPPPPPFGGGDVLNLKTSIHNSSDVYLKSVEYTVLYWYRNCGKLWQVIQLFINYKWQYWVLIWTAETVESEGCRDIQTVS
jgi:hypothetical protein